MKEERKKINNNNVGGSGRSREEEKLFTGGLKCETNDFVTLVKPRGGMAAWVITVRQRAGN